MDENTFKSSEHQYHGINDSVQLYSEVGGAEAPEAFSLTLNFDKYKINLEIQTKIWKKARNN